MRILGTLIVASVCAFFALPGFAQSTAREYPTKNRAGGGGIIATQLVSKAAPDGYTLLMNYTSHAINPSLYAKLPYDSEKSFAPVTLLGQVPLVLVVPQEFPARNMAEFVSYAKANPGKLNFGSAAIGGASHLGGELLNTMAGVDIQHVPYKGGAAAAMDLASGRLSMVLDSFLPLQPYIKAGKIRPLGVASAKRSEMAPELPTIAETVPGFEASAWFGIVVPATTPREIIARLNAEFVKALRDPELRRRLTQQGFDPGGNSPEEFSAFMREETEKWARVIRKAGVKVE
ncbi:MAG: tripartite tricarboxylate transporter substrate binding protein [Proteobacteria bacterium]|nr:tripartite tricarboxylate transporter substrate binding protein [Pseudomonadota bacterium]